MNLFTKALIQGQYFAISMVDKMRHPARILSD
jgi:hypothetical protein